MERYFISILIYYLYGWLAAAAEQMWYVMYESSSMINHFLFADLVILSLFYKTVWILKNVYKTRFHDC